MISIFRKFYPIKKVPGKSSGKQSKHLLWQYHKPPLNKITSAIYVNAPAK